MIRLQTYFVWFFVYSFIGWIWEVFFCSAQAGELINRGFLNGPYCPIYGTGAMLVIAVLYKVKNPIQIFLASALLTCSLEYLTSWGLEKLFHARWWDYSEDFMNINGRVYLGGAIGFGLLCLILLKFLHPVIEKYTSRLSMFAISSLALAFLTLMLTDTVYTVSRFSNFEAKLKELTEKIDTAIASSEEQQRAISGKFYDNELYARLAAYYEEMSKRINSQEARLLKAFPGLQPIQYNEALLKIRGRVLEDVEKTAAP